MPSPFELVAFNPSAICESCHGTRVRIDIIPADGECLHARVPHFHRKCERCGHYWGETPIAADIGGYDYLRAVRQ